MLNQQMENRMIGEIVIKNQNVYTTKVDKMY